MAPGGGRGVPPPRRPFGAGGGGAGAPGPVARRGAFGDLAAADGPAHRRTSPREAQRHGAGAFPVWDGHRAAPWAPGPRGAGPWAACSQLPWWWMFGFGGRLRLGEACVFVFVCAARRRSLSNRLATGSKKRGLHGGGRGCVSRFCSLPFGETEVADTNRTPPPPPPSPLGVPVQWPTSEWARGNHRNGKGAGAVSKLMDSSGTPRVQVVAGPGGRLFGF